MVGCRRLKQGTAGRQWEGSSIQGSWGRAETTRHRQVSRSVVGGCEADRRKNHPTGQTDQARHCPSYGAIPLTYLESGARQAHSADGRTVADHQSDSHCHKTEMIGRCTAQAGHECKKEEKIILDVSPPLYLFSPRGGKPSIFPPVRSGFRTSFTTWLTYAASIQYSQLCAAKD